MTLVVLAGGRSRRMGRDKALLPVARGILLERVTGALAGFFDEIVVSVSSGRRARLLEDRLSSLARPAPVLCLADEVAGQGPLRGILTGLRASRNAACFVVACDMPDVSPSAVRALVRKAAACDCAVAVSSNGLKEPLLGVYKRSCIPPIEDLLSAGRRSVLDLFGLVRTVYVALGPDVMPININTPADYHAFLGRTPWQY